MNTPPRLNIVRVEDEPKIKKMFDFLKKCPDSKVRRSTRDFLNSLEGYAFANGFLTRAQFEALCNTYEKV